MVSRKRNALPCRTTPFDSHRFAMWLRVRYDEPPHSAAYKIGSGGVYFKIGLRAARVSSIRRTGA